jgi:hypothetical protein
MAEPIFIAAKEGNIFLCDELLPCAGNNEEERDYFQVQAEQSGQALADTDCSPMITQQVEGIE